MRKSVLSTLATAFLLSVSAFGAEAPSASIAIPLPFLPPPGPEFVGVTKAEVLGNAVALARACQAEFRQSHVCTSTEILQSWRLPTFAPDDSFFAWVNPTIVGIVDHTLTRDQEYLLLDASGVVLQTESLGRSAPCVGEGSDATVAIDETGGFNTVSCDNARRVACCTRR